MKITFLGTKGFIEESSSDHKYHSSILIERGNTRLLIDYGRLHPKSLDEIKPTHILLTHGHPDHCFGFRDETEDGIDVYMLDRVWNSLPEKVREKLDHKPFHMHHWEKIGDLEVYAFPVSHSIDFPTNGFLIRNDKTVCYCPDVLSITNRKLILRNADIYIGDGSYITDKPGRVRYHKETGRPYGHALIRDQVKWCAQSDVPIVIFTHFGKEAVEHPDKLKEHLKNLSKEFDVKVMEAKDGMTIDTTKLGQPGIYLVPPHARLITEGKKTAIVSTRPCPKQYLDVPIHLIEDKKSYGLIRITECHGPLDAEFVRTQLRHRHQITDREWRDWWPDAKQVYVYDFKIDRLWDEPVPVEVPQGIQKWIRDVRVNLAELTAYALDEEGNLTKFGQAKQYRVNGKTIEIIGSGVERAKKLVEMGVKKVICAAIGEASRTVLEQNGVKVEVRASLIKPERVKEVLKHPELLKEWTDEQLLDDHRICHLWAGKNWKTLPHDLTKEEVKRFHDLLVEEMNRRGMEHTTPLELERSVTTTERQSYDNLKDNLLESSNISEVNKQIVEEVKEPSPYAPVHHIETGEDTIELETVLEAWSKPIILKKGYVTLVGGLSNHGRTDGDIDVLIGDREWVTHIHQPLLFRLGRALPDDLGERIQMMFVGEYGGPFTNHIPIYDLVLIPSADRRLIRMEKVPTRIKQLRDRQAFKEALESYREDEVKPLRFVIPLKGYRAHYRFADLVPEVVEEWFERDVYPIYAQKKYDGFRVLLMKQGDKIIIRSEDGEDVTKRFPKIIEQAKKILPHTCTLDIEAELWKDGKHQPREEAAGYAHARTPPDDSGFVFNVFDVLYFYDESVEHHELSGTIGDLHKHPYELRLRYLSLIDFPQSTDDTPKTPAFNLTPTYVAHNPEELAKLVRKCSDFIASEGAVVKSSKSDYPLDGLTDQWLKFKKMAEIHAIVLDNIETKTKGVYNLVVGVRVPPGWKVPEKHLRELNGKKYIVIGKTFNVKGYKKPGTIVTVSFHTLNHYIDSQTGEQWIHIYEPKFIEVREGQKTPDSAEDAIKIAHDLELLTVKRLALTRFPMDDKPHQAVLQHHYRCELEQLLPDVGEPGSPWFELALDELIQRLGDHIDKIRVFLGRSVHTDFRIKVNDHLEGFTIMDAKPGAIKEPVTSVEQAKELEKDWDKYFKLSNDPQTYIASPRRKLWVEQKKSEPKEWLNVERVVKPGEVGATKHEYGVFSIFDRPIVYFGAVKPDFLEMFLYGKKFNGRWVVRLLPNPWKREMPRREFVLLMWKPEDQTPYVLSSRAVRRKWIPPKGISCLPPEIRQQIPEEYRYWKFDDKQKRLEVRDKLVEAIRKGEVRIRPVTVKRRK